MNEYFETIKALTKENHEELHHGETYINDADGLKYCKKCGKPLEKIFEVVRGTFEKFPQHCDCMIETDKNAEQEKRKASSRDRRIKCFYDEVFHNYTFENDDGKNAELSTICRNYVKNFDDKFRKDGIGLHLHGTSGNGKTFAACCIANALIDKGYICKFSRLTRRVNDYGSSPNKNSFLDDIAKSQLIVIDDFGFEKNNEVVFSIIDTIYENKRPVIVTSNLTNDDLKRDDDVVFKRIIDRIRGRSVPYLVQSPSRRTDKLKVNLTDYKQILGLK